MQMRWYNAVYTFGVFEGMAEFEEIAKRGAPCEDLLLEGDGVRALPREVSIASIR